MVFIKIYNIQLISDFLKNGKKTNDIFAEFTPKSVLAQFVLKDFLDEMKSTAESLYNTVTPELPYSLFSLFDKTGNRIKYEKVYFDRRCRLATFALMAWLYESDKDIAELEDIMWAICGEYTWALPSHMGGNSINKFADENTIDLFATETAQALSEILVLFKGRLSEPVVLRCKREIERRVLYPFIEAKEAFHWESIKNNWAAVCGGSIGMTAICLIDSDEELAKYIYKLFPAMQSFLDGFEDDGVCLEGLGYWTYGFSYFTAYADMLLKRTSGNINLFDDDKVRLISGFQSSCYLSGGRTVSFADGETKGRFKIGLTSYLINMFNISSPPISCAAGYNNDNCYRFCMLFRDLIWTTDRLSNTTSYMKNIDFPVSQWHIWNTDKIGAAVKGGHNAEPHNHNDVGNFLVYLNGGELLTDLGSGEYTKEYFSENRYKVFCNSSFSHNVPVINGEGQPVGKDFCASYYQFDAPDNVIIDIENAYNLKSLTKLRREICFSADKFELKDSFKFDAVPESVEERFITKQWPEITDNYVLFKTEFGDSAKLYYSPDTYEINISTHKHAEHDGSYTDVYAVSFVVKNLDTEMNFDFCLKFN